jgi:hypothetical protein
MNRALPTLAALACLLVPAAPALAEPAVTFEEEMEAQQLPFMQSSQGASPRSTRYANLDRMLSARLDARLAAPAAVPGLAAALSVAPAAAIGGLALALNNPVLLAAMPATAGLGQLYAGDRQRALGVTLGAGSAFLAGGLASVALGGQPLLGGGLANGLFTAWSGFDAYHAAQRGTEEGLLR